MDYIYDELIALSDNEYKKFHSALMPTVEKESILGIRVPNLRKYAKQLFKVGGYEPFLEKLPHKYYEENNLHAFLIEQIKDFDEAIKKTEEFLPYIDNWATCDMFTPIVFKKNKKKLLPFIKKWLKSDKTYTVRYGVKLLMALYLDEDFNEEHMELLCSIKTEEYYINMAIAWYFATALAKQEKSALKYIENNRLGVWVHNKSIQKAIESKRISPEMKKHLKKQKK